MSIAELTASGKVYGVGSTGPDVEMIQRALLAAGAAIVVDGEFGSITDSAVKRFQAAHELAVDGQVGPLTAAKLDEAIATPEAEEVEEAGSVLKSAPWLAEMRAITGVREVPGSASSAIIMSWRSDIGRAFPEMASYAASYTGDAIPWCGFGLARCCAVHDVKPPFGKTDTARFMWAGSWAKWGRKLPKPVVGCIMTFTREGGGHVSLLEKISGDTVWVRGCNQSDMVNVARMSMSRFTAATWPQGRPVPKRQLEGNILNAVDAGRLA